MGAGGGVWGCGVWGGGGAGRGQRRGDWKGGGVGVRRGGLGGGGLRGGVRMLQNLSCAPIASAVRKSCGKRFRTAAQPSVSRRRGQ